jgi:hypothetical protein
MCRVHARGREIGCGAWASTHTECFLSLFSVGFSHVPGGHVRLRLTQVFFSFSTSTSRGIATSRYGVWPNVSPSRDFCAKEHRARVHGRATARHLHGKIERAARCLTVKVSAESAGAVASNVFFESLTTRQSGRRLAQPDGGAGTPARRGCHLQGRPTPPSWTTP